MPIRSTSPVVQFLFVALPKGANGAAQLALNIMILRALRPEAAGALFVCLTAAILLDAVLGAAVDTGVIRLTTARDERDTPESVAIQKAALVGKLTAACVGLALVMAWGKALSSMLFQTSAHDRLLMMTVVTLGGMLILRSIQTYFQLSGAFTLYGASETMHGVLRFGGVALLIWMKDATPMSILFCYALGPFVAGGVFLCTAAKPLLRAHFSLRRLRGLFVYVKWYLCAAAVGTLTSRMDMLLVSADQGSRAAGLFSAAQAMVIVFQVLGAYVGIVCAPKVLPLLNKGRLAAIYWRFQTIVAVFSIAAFFVFPMALDKLGHLLPPSYDEARPVMIALLPSALMSMANFPWTITLLLCIHPKLMFFIELLALPVLFFVYRFGIGAYGVLGAAGVTSGYALAKTAALQFLAWRTMRNSNNMGGQLAPAA